MEDFLENTLPVPAVWEGREAQAAAWLETGIILNVKIDFNDCFDCTLIQNNKYQYILRGNKGKMKFRAKIIDVMCIRQFTQLITNVSRLAKVCVMRLSSDRVCLVVSEGGALGGSPGLWAELEHKHYFSEYTMEGVSDEDNMILLEIQAEKLAKTLNILRTSHFAKGLKIKLTKKHTPCLSFEVELTSLTERGRIVNHDVPVGLIPRRLWTMHKEPKMSNPVNVSLYFPPIKAMRHVVDRMKALSPHLTIAASRNGVLILSISNDVVNVSTTYKNVVNPSWEGQTSCSEEEKCRLHSITIDIKKISCFLQTDPNPSSTVVCNIVAGKVLHLFLLQDNITLQYFLPAVIDHR